MKVSATGQLMVEIIFSKLRSIKLTSFGVDMTGLTGRRRRIRVRSGPPKHECIALLVIETLKADALPWRIPLKVEEPTIYDNAVKHFMARQYSKA